MVLALSLLEAPPLAKVPFAAPSVASPAGRCPDFDAARGGLQIDLSFVLGNWSPRDEFPRGRQADDLVGFVVGKPWS